MNYSNISSRLKANRYTIAAIMALLVYQSYIIPNISSDQRVWHAVGYTLLGIGVLVSGGGHRVLLKQRQTAKAAVGLAAIFTAIPIAFFTIPDIVNYAFRGPSTIYIGGGGEVEETLSMIIVEGLSIHVDILFWTIPLTMATLIAATRPTSAIEVRETFWFTIPVVVAIITFMQSMEALYYYLVPGLDPFSLGVGAYSVETVGFIYFSIFILAVAWAAGVIAYTQLDDAEIGTSPTFTDGGE